MPKLTLSKQFEFTASHALTGMQEGHACATEHSHNYVLELTLEGSQTNGLILDSGRLKADVWPVIKRVAGRKLNDLTDPAAWARALAAQPSCENFALYFWHALGFLSKGPDFRLTRLRLYESPKLFTEVSGEPLPSPVPEQQAPEPPGEPLLTCAHCGSTGYNQEYCGECFTPRDAAATPQGTHPWRPPSAACADCGELPMHPTHIRTRPEFHAVDDDAAADPVEPQEIAGMKIHVDPK